MTNFNSYRGDSWSAVLTFTENSLAKNITGWTIFFTLKKTIDDSDDASTTIKKTVTTHTNPTGGISTVSLTPTDTAELLGTYYYDIQYKDGSGNIKTVASGEFTFTKDVTRRTT